MKNLSSLSLLIVAAVSSMFLLTGCPNPDNQIPPNCFDGILNNGEQLTDCGGPCVECDHCIDGIYQPELGEVGRDCGGPDCETCNQCENLSQDGDEVGIDCGGTNCGPCADLCGDGLLNGQETEVDCGGPWDDLNLNGVYDWDTEVWNNFCEPCPRCNDGHMNGDEVGIDCGGSNCPPCNSDGSCIDGVMNGEEFWTDCGGVDCPSCDTILTWTVSGVNYEATSFLINSVGGNVTVVGTCTDGTMMAVNIAIPIGGWINGMTIPISSSTAPNTAFVETVLPATTYSSGNGAASMTFNLVKYASNISATRPGHIRGTFTGSMRTTNNLQINVTNGFLQFPMQ